MDIYNQRVDRSWKFEDGEAQEIELESKCPGHANSHFFN